MTELLQWYIFAPLEELLSWVAFFALVWAVWGMFND